MQQALTPKIVRDLKPNPSGGDLIVTDALLPGFGVRVYPSGRKAYWWNSRREGRQTIGSVDVYTLDEARDEARENKKLYRKGINVRKHKAAEIEANLAAERCGNRERICKIVNELEKQSANLDKALAKAAKHYTALEGCVRSVLSYGENAEGFDLRTFKTSHPLQAPYTFAIHCLSEHFEWGPSHHLEAWPKPYGRDEAKARAFADFRAARDDWRNPPEPELEGPVEFEEVSPEEMSNAVL